MKIGIDPGHGGRDPGAVGPTGLREKDVSLAVSLELSRLLRELSLNTHLTRDKDMYLSLDNRSAMLNQEKCDLAISVHCNSSWNRTASYISAFIQGQGGQAEKLAERVQAELVKATGWPDGGVRIKNLHMTRETKMPAVLVECGFISNPEQEKQLADPAFQRNLARALTDGVLDYLGIKRKEGEIMSDIKVIVKGKEIPGKLINSQTWVPLRELIDALANEVAWDEDNRVAIVK